jgi:hypothetical protein
LCDVECSPGPPPPLEHPTVVLYCKPESGKKWKDVNCGSGQQGKSLYSSFIYRLKSDFGRFFRGLVNGFGLFCFGKTLRFGRTTFS